MTRSVPPVSVGDHSIGSHNALVTLIEYGDYECPYCGEAYPVLKAVQQAMGMRLRFVFRNFPLVDMHPHALRAAEFAEAAAIEGQFWAAHDLLYEHQNALDDESLIVYGDRLGLSRVGLLAAFEGSVDAKIRTDFSGGVYGGVNGTPCLFINGARYDGPRDVDSLVAVLDQMARTSA
ncbi:DsbA family protein [Ancylobacter sp. Lp-2]|uniref:DsbA family protein n=1 Tax=Ancylobacter sp. Lp-2 TaxID=2881339 RepID=UPI001E647979|nr:DsbA family protein [Ancylobacter sp. Lp-2]MCB4767671.1 DsbA family protein [Ancylobacter sp. Lp-2]